MVHETVRQDEPECFECGGSPSFLVIPTGAAERNWDGSRKHKESFHSCGRDLTKALRRTPRHSAIVRVLD